jgi:hypothetical protein
LVLSKQAHGDIVLFVPWKRVIFGPAFFSQVGNDALAGDFSGYFPKQCFNLLYPGFMMPDPAVAHPIFWCPLQIRQGSG